MANQIEVLSSLQSVPGVVWGAVITLSGVMFSDWKNTKRLLLQQQLTAKESERIRTLALRKEVYLPVAGAISHALDHLLSLGTMDARPGEHTPMAELGEALSKVSMVAETETAVIAQELATALSSAHVALALAAVPASRARTDAMIHAELRKKALGEVDRLMLEINKFLEAAKTDQIVFDALNRRRDSAQAETQRHWTLEAEALKRAAQEANSYIRTAVATLEPVSVKTIGLLVEIRKELGVETDSAEFARALNEGRDRVIANLHAAIDTLERDLSEQCADSRTPEPT